MSQILPDSTTVGDLCAAALKLSNAVGIGQAATAEELNDCWALLQWMFQQWFEQRWLVYHLETKVVTSTGQLTYTVGPGGQFDTGVGSTRPNRIESGFLRQFGTSGSDDFGGDFGDDFGGVAGAGPIDYPLELLQSMEDYADIPLKQLQSFPSRVFYDPGFPLGLLYAWPVAQANIYGIGIVIRAQLPTSFPTLATKFVLPYAYYWAIVTNLAMMLRSKYGIGSWPGDLLPAQAKASLAVLRPANTAIARLRMPASFGRPGLYNIFSDRNY